MKKLYAVAVVLSLAGTASAASVMFDFGTNFYKPAANGYLTQNGQNFTLGWMLDNDLSLGVYTEQSNTMIGAVAGTLSVSSVQIAKGVVKNVMVGLNLGAATGAVGAANNTAALADVFGAVNILTGTGEKVSGALRALASARFSKASLTGAAGGAAADGYNLGLAVEIGF